MKLNSNFFNVIQKPLLKIIGKLIINSYIRGRVKLISKFSDKNNKEALTRDTTHAHEMLYSCSLQHSIVQLSDEAGNNEARCNF